MGLIDWLLARVPDDYSLGWATYLAVALMLSLQAAWLLRRLPLPPLRLLLWLLLAAPLFTPVPVADGTGGARLLPALTTVPLAVIQARPEDLALALRALTMSLAAVVALWTLSFLTLAWYRIRAAALARIASPVGSGRARRRPNGIQWSPLSNRRRGGRGR